VPVQSSSALVQDVIQEFESISPLSSQSIAGPAPPMHTQHFCFSTIVCGTSNDSRSLKMIIRSQPGTSLEENHTVPCLFCSAASTSRYIVYLRAARSEHTRVYSKTAVLRYHTPAWSQSDCRAVIIFYQIRAQTACASSRRATAPIFGIRRIGWALSHTRWGELRRSRTGRTHFGVTTATRRA